MTQWSQQFQPPTLKFGDQILSRGIALQLKILTYHSVNAIWKLITKHNVARRAELGKLFFKKSALLIHYSKERDGNYDSWTNLWKA